MGLTKLEFAGLRREARARLDDAERQMERITRTTPTALLPQPGALTAAWPAMTLDERRAVLAAVIDHVVVAKATPPFSVFKPRTPPPGVEGLGRPPLRAEDERLEREVRDPVGHVEPLRDEPRGDLMAEPDLRGHHWS